MKYGEMTKEYDSAICVEFKARGAEIRISWDDFKFKIRSTDFQKAHEMDRGGEKPGKGIWRVLIFQK